ncbi:4'-phosphopantetheinyl transferase family protein [Aeromicrobium sp. CF3.5]|uniref:4'-phosphopantetheinyl transferase family protein n=1 Tax=Aeromicrobium sp. CF3.5 TaxID=3373078 RepID=UPI003EE4EFEF
MTVLWTAEPERLRQMTLAAAADITGVDLEDLRLVRACPQCGSASHGRPIVLGGPTVHVSLSRCHDRGVSVLAAEGPVGVDVEPVRPPAGLTPRRVAHWVRVEALLKLTGDGLTVDPEAVDTADVAGLHRVRQWPAGSARPGAFALDLDVGPHHVAAIALPDRGQSRSDVSLRWAASEA